MALKINLINKQSNYKLPLSHLEDLAKYILKKQGIKNTELNILFADNKRIKEFNNRFLKKNKVTDVISFYEAKTINQAKKISYLGEMIVSVEAARKQAATYGNSIIREIRLYIIHGLLHLLGYKDYTVSEKNKMSALEKKLLCQYEEKKFNR
jgi:probable rRNA maturation factor